MLNNCNIMGRICKDIEMRYTQQGKPVCSFTIACDRDFDKDKCDFIPCTAWGKTAEFASKYFRKGSLAVVTGQLQMRDWEDKNGNKRRNAEIIVGSMYFGSNKQAGENTNGFVEVDEEDDGDLPF